MYDYQPNSCGPVYITVGETQLCAGFTAGCSESMSGISEFADYFCAGDGGNLEQLAVPMADQPGNCPAMKLTR